MVVKLKLYLNNLKKQKRGKAEQLGERRFSTNLYNVK